MAVNPQNPHIPAINVIKDRIRRWSHQIGVLQPLVVVSLKIELFLYSHQYLSWYTLAYRLLKYMINLSFEMEV